MYIPNKTVYYFFTAGNMASVSAYTYHCLRVEEGLKKSLIVRGRVFLSYTS